MRALLFLSWLVAVASHAQGLGDGFGGGTRVPAAVVGTITYPAIVNVQVGGYVSLTPTVLGLTPGTYSVVAGALPDGLSLDASTGAITGTVTTTALKANAKASMGASPDLGEHLVVVDAGDASGTRATLSVNVYGVDIPNPQSLFVASSEYDSGSTFIDAIDGTVFNLTTGTQDADLTDTTSPLGYSHKFNSSTYFSRASTPTLPDPVRNTFAVLLRLSDASHGGVAQNHLSVGDDGTGGAGRLLQTTARYLTTANAFPLLGASFPNDPSWQSLVSAATEGVGFSSTQNGVLSTLTSTGSMLPGSQTLRIGTGELHAAPRHSGAFIAEAAYWPRALSALHAAVVDWCWFRGISLTDCDGNQAPTATTTIDLTEPSTAFPVTYDGTYTLTGTATNVTGITWRIGSGSTTPCTGTTSWSCAVTHSPTSGSDAAVTVTITATGTSNLALARQDVGFYDPSVYFFVVDATNVDGTFNSSFADGDSVTTWVDLGTGDNDVTQGSAGSKPTFRSRRAESPYLSFDGGDFLDAATAADWTFLHDGSDVTVEVIYAADSYATTQYLLNTNDAAAGACTTTGKGYCLRVLATTTASCSITSGSGAVVGCGTMGAVLTSGRHHLLFTTIDDDGGGGNDLLAYSDNTLRTSNTRSGSYATDGGSPLRIGRSLGSTTQGLVGGIVAVRIRQTAASATSRAINSAVDSWRVGGLW
jgi:hypothetical protein